MSCVSLGKGQANWFASEWWRLKYDLTVSHIRPRDNQKGVRFYDPWDDFGVKEAPFVDLARVAESPSPSEAALLFANRWGLPGTFLHSLLEWWLPPRARLQDVKQVGYVRSTLGWEVVVRHGHQTDHDPQSPLVRPVRGHTEADECQAWLTTELKGWDAVPQDGLALPWSPPGAILRTWSSTCVSTQSVAATAAAYFPSVRPEDAWAFPWPVPGSKAFACAYAEPLQSFNAAAVRFQEIILGLSEPRAALTMETAMTDSWSARVKAHRLLDGVSPAFRRIGKQRTVQLCSSSLLGTMAAMLALSMASTKMPTRCSHCHMIYCPRSANSLYCSDSCRSAAKQRRYRVKRKNSNLLPG